jgi:hypothetical protein
MPLVTQRHSTLELLAISLWPLSPIEWPLSSETVPTLLRDGGYFAPKNAILIHIL